MSRPRYVIRPHARYDDDYQLLEGTTVFEGEPVNTGLVSAARQPIFRVKAPVGFFELEERD